MHICSVISKVYGYLRTILIVGFPDFRVDFWISEWISGFQSGFLDFRMDFWISDWISGLQWISGFLPTVYEISFVTDPSGWVPCQASKSSRSQSATAIQR